MSGNFPKISVITPSKNCATFLRRAIESVKSQDYPNIEHIVVDGASTDASVEILRSYPHIRWISEADSGEAEALNRALKLCSGELVNWLNADDYYVGPNVFSQIVREFQLHPSFDVIYGRGIAVNETGQVTWYRMPVNPLNLYAIMNWTVDLNIIQPAMFIKKSVFDAIGSFRQDLKYAIDNDLWLRIAAKGFRFHFLNKPLACATLVRTGAKSSGSVEEQHAAWHAVTNEFEKELSPEMRINYWRDYYRFRLRNPAGYTSPLTVQNSEYALMGLAIASLEQGDIQAAIASVKQLSQALPQAADTYLLMSEIMLKTGHNEQSKQAAEVALELLK